MADSHWQYLEPSHMIGAMLQWMVASFFLGVVLALVGTLVWGGLWLVLAAPVAAAVLVFWLLSRHLMLLRHMPLHL